MNRRKRRAELAKARGSKVGRRAKRGATVETSDQKSKCSDEDAWAEQDVPEKARFLMLYGAAMIQSLHVQYRLADVYAASFDDPRGGCLPRVHEKWRAAFEATLGGAHTMTREWLPLALRIDVEAAVDVRNYLAHYFIFDTRAQQATPEGRAGLVERLMVAFHFFADVNDRLVEQHKQVFVKAGGSLDMYEAHLVPWGDLDEPPPAGPLPGKRERIVAVYSATDALGSPWLYFENDRGAFWQATDVGLATVNVNPEQRARFTAVARLQPYLPADVVSRPSSKSNPPAWRSAFNYDLSFSTGAMLRIERLPDSRVVTFEVV